MCIITCFVTGVCGWWSEKRTMFRPFKFQLLLCQDENLALKYFTRMDPPMLCLCSCKCLLRKWRWEAVSCAPLSYLDNCCFCAPQYIHGSWDCTKVNMTLLHLVFVVDCWYEVLYDDLRIKFFYSSHLIMKGNVLSIYLNFV